MGRTADYSNQSCSMARSLAILGEPWTLLILRDAFLGCTRFEQWRDGLGVARNVLAARLKSLAAEGLLEKRPYNTRPLRHEYLLTSRGKAALPVLLALKAWGEGQLGAGGEAFPTLTHATCGHVFEAVPACKACGEAIRFRDLRREPRPALVEG